MILGLLDEKWIGDVGVFRLLCGGVVGGTFLKILKPNNALLSQRSTPDSVCVRRPERAVDLGERSEPRSMCPRRAIGKVGGGGCLRALAFYRCELSLNSEGILTSTLKIASQFNETIEIEEVRPSRRSMKVEPFG